MSCAGCAFNTIETDDRTSIYNWRNDLPDTSDQTDLVEVKFKTTRKEFFRNTEGIPLKRGDKVVQQLEDTQQEGVVYGGIGARYFGKILTLFLLG